MIILIAAFAGALWGSHIARKRKGNLADILQYGAGYGIAFALLGLFVTILLNRIV
ncbi:MULTISPECIES: hypothetical protein [unclassified Meridianimarinicoccus]|uniref:hypothetical protein n=1 Tax=unclassified Meridianimarinicoccus TaxID=2923344 RepID=UPI001867BB01|nr:hypothetical protein [Fluviibacterium sp. MJW13]